MHPLGRNVRLHPLLLACVLLLSHASVPAFAQLSAGSSAFVNTASLSGSSTPSASAASTSSASTTTAPKHTQFILSGTSKPKTTSEEAIELLSNSTNTDRPTSTTAHAGPVNTQPCNLYLEFCDRSYGLITQVGTHNSPFVRPNNAAANQKLDVETQLNDGVRLLQGQVHPLNGTLRYCHTSCDLLNAGTVVDYLTRVVNWINDNPFQVVTLVIANGDYVDVKEFVDPIETSGLAQLAYIPENRTMTYKEWPTLSDLILKNKRAIIFMDYQANETEVPYILDEFTYMWETKFSQTDPSFPCNVDRPPDVGGWMDKMYMANHNLNVDLSLLGVSALVPNTVAINQTNGVEGYGSLGLQSYNCDIMWGRYPNNLLVDFYEAGNGSVFEVAAKANNVTYLGGCCGKIKSLAAGGLMTSPMVLFAQTALLAAFFVLV